MRTNSRIYFFLLKTFISDCDNCHLCKLLLNKTVGKAEKIKEEKIENKKSQNEDQKGWEI